MADEHGSDVTTTDARPAAEGEELLSLDQAVQFLSTSRPTLYRLLGQGDLKGLKVGRQWRFRKTDLVAYLERRPAGMASAPAEALEAELGYFEEELRRVGAAPPEEESSAVAFWARLKTLRRVGAALPEEEIELADPG